MKFAATNEARIARAAPRCILLGAERMEVKDRFIVFERINGDCAAFQELHAEYGCLFFCSIGTKFGIAPFASGLFVERVDVSRMCGKKLNLFP